jgi:hypothetical protein
VTTGVDITAGVGVVTSVGIISDTGGSGFSPNTHSSLSYAVSPSFMVCCHMPST